MANTKLSLSSKVDKTTKQSEVLIQLRCGTFSQRVKSRVFIFPKYFDAKKHKITITQRTLTKEVVAMQQEENLGALNDLSEEVRQDIDNLYIAIRELAARLEEKKNEPRLRIGFRT